MDLLLSEFSLGCRLNWGGGISNYYNYIRCNYDL